MRLANTIRWKGQDAEASCVPCPKGTYSPTTAAVSASSCLECPSGTYNALEVKRPFLLVIVPQANLVTKAGALTLKVDAMYIAREDFTVWGAHRIFRESILEKYNNLTGQSSNLSCIECGARKFGDSNAQISEALACKICDKGFICSGTTRVENPVIGTFNNRSQQANVASCISCPGKYGVDSGQANSTSGCRVCEKGFYCPPGNGRLRFACKKGTYNNLTGQVHNTDCLSCPSGKYGDYRGNSMHSVSSDGTGLGKCSGDCDSDSDCRGTLKCFQCDGICLVPGCGTGVQHWDYCYDPLEHSICKICEQGYYCNGGLHRTLCHWCPQQFNWTGAQ